MNLQLQNRRALVSGSSAGIGFAIAQLLAMEGASVVTSTGVRRNASEAAAKKIRDSGAKGRVHCFHH